MVVWKERGEKGLCLCPEAGEDVTPELEDLWRFHGVTGLCLEGGSGLTGEEKMSMEGLFNGVVGIRVASIAEGLADKADELFCIDESVVVVVVVESGHVV